MSKCSKLLVLVAVIGMVCGSAFADWKADYKAAAYLCWSGASVAEAQAACDKVMSNPTCPENMVRWTKSNMATCLICHKQYDEAIIRLTQLLEDYPDGFDARFYAEVYSQLRVAYLYKQDYSNRAKVAVKYIAWASQIKAATNAVIVRMWGYVAPQYFTTEEYIAALQEIVKAVPATEVNAPFLGRVKSELEKVK